MSWWETSHQDIAFFLDYKGVICHDDLWNNHHFNVMFLISCPDFTEYSRVFSIIIDRDLDSLVVQPSRGDVEVFAESLYVVKRHRVPA